MAPKIQNFTLYRGDTHLFKVRLTAEATPLDLSQTHFQMNIVWPTWKLQSSLQPQLKKVRSWLRYKRKSKGRWRIYMVGG